MTTLPTTAPIEPILTAHARKRMQQRGVALAVLEWAFRFGDRMRAPGGCRLLYFGKRAWQRLRAVTLSAELRRQIDRARGLALVVDGNRPIVITVVRTADIGRMRQRA